MQSFVSTRGTAEGWDRGEGGEEVTHRTTLSSFISLSKLISRIAVLGTPSSSASSRIFFSATIWFVSLFRERYCSRAKRAKGQSRGVVVQHRFLGGGGRRGKRETENSRRRHRCLDFVQRQSGMQQSREERKREPSANLARFQHPLTLPHATACRVPPRPCLTSLEVRSTAPSACGEGATRASERGTRLRQSFPTARTFRATFSPDLFRLCTSSSSSKDRPWGMS